MLYGDFDGELVNTLKPTSSLKEGLLVEWNQKKRRTRRRQGKVGSRMENMMWFLQQLKLESISRERARDMRTESSNQLIVNYSVSSVQFVDLY